MTQDQEYELLLKAVNGLGEYFDAVQLLASRHESGSEDGTISYAAGCGNHFSRVGLATEWLAKVDERSRRQVREEHRE